MMRKDDIECAFSLFPCFAELTTQDFELATLLKVSPRLMYTEHKLQHAVFVLSGSLRVYKISSSGREVTLYRVQSGEFCVLMMASILGEIEYDASIQVETETNMLLFPAADFRKWMYINKSIRQMVYRQFILRWTHIANLLEQIAFISIHERILEFLKERHIDLGHTTDTIKITHEQLSIEIGTSREVVSRALKEFSNKGAILLQRGKIKIIDLNKIKI